MAHALTDDALLTGFEDGTLAVESFDHVSHIRVAWIYQGRVPSEQALQRVCAGLKRLTARAGVLGKYHATITWAYCALIAERRRENEVFDDFRSRCPELFDGSALRSVYSTGELDADRARREFVLPAR